MALRILHTADLHDRLDRARSEALGFLRDRTGALLLDSGDAVGAGNVYVRAREPVIEEMNRAGYAAMALGNREFFFRRSGLIRKTAAAHFPVLAANLLPLHGDLGHVMRWTQLTSGDETVGLFGLMPTMIAPGHPFERVSDVRFIEWQAAAVEAVEALRERVDWLIALSHLGSEDDRALTELCPQIDLILGGHSHISGSSEVGPRPTLVSYAGCHARQVAVIEAERDERARNQFEWRLMEMG
ncbi:MAG: hypothetical protein GX131_05935 [candidate division WS1 bacterium]|jgi:2',3'-cyclic-nucleotide 2'-phosphodiesterase (5'-nucleotidase family)|nr:hypothetical protein [candidate division WS1 bacterium]